LTGILLSLSLAVYVLLRAPVSGFRVARMLLNESRALTWRNRGSALAHCARDLDVAGEELRLFKNLRQPRRRDPPVDLLVKAAIAGSLWFGFVYALRYGNTDALGVAVVSPLALRLLWLAAEGFRRGQWVALVAGILVVSAVASIAPDFGDVYEPDLPSGHTARSRVERSQSLAFTASALEQSRFRSRRALRGIDLRGRSLDGLHLWHIDLKGAQLTNANLAYIDLSQSCLADALMRGVNFAGADLRGADLRGADLTGANLHGAKLAGAGYDGQTVWPDGYPGRSGARPVAPVARSRCDVTSGADLPGWAEAP
jgi:Pentapeptide repeats (8 copies)